MRRLDLSGGALLVGAVVLVTTFSVATIAGAVEIIQIRSGQVGSLPGTACAQLDDGFRCLVSTGCAFPLRSVPFTPADFAAAQAGPKAEIVTPAAYPWAPGLAYDPQARWINWQAGGGCLGQPTRSVLYAYKFHVNTPCNPIANIDMCWVADDRLGDPPAGGPNPAGVYINGTPLAPFSGGNYATELCSSVQSFAVLPGDNWLYVYQRDAGCDRSGLIMSMTLTITSASGCPTIGIVKFDDVDGDGVQDFGEPGLPYWQFTATGPQTYYGATDTNGLLFFNCVQPGSYALTEVNQPGWIQTAPAGGVCHLNVTCDLDFACAFGNHECTTTGCTEMPSCVAGWYPFNEGSGTVANEILANRDGAVLGGFASPNWGPGRPGGGLGMQFPGLPGTQSVAVPNCPEHNFGTGSFSVAAWVKTAMSDFTVRTILDKREWVGGNVRGWVMYLYGGVLRLQYGDGSGGFTTYTSTGPVVGDGAWHTVGFSVCRTPGDPVANIAWLAVDGYVNTFTTGIPTGTVSNAAGLVIGDQCPGFIPGTPFLGSVDDVQLYTCCISPDQLIALHSPAVSYCLEGCWAPSIQSAYGSTVNVTFKICNYASTPQTYSWSIAGLPSGPGCNVNGPTAYAPPSGTVTVPAATSVPSCVNVPVTVAFPPMIYPQNACYQVTVRNNATGHCFSAHGAVRKLGDFEISWDHVEAALPVGGGAVPVPFTVRNGGDLPLALDYSLTERPPEGGSEAAALKLNGLPPGEPVLGTLLVAPHDSSRVPVGLELTRFEALGVREVLISADLDGDGIPDPIASLGVTSETMEVASGVPGLPATTGGATTAPVPMIRLAANPNPFQHGTAIQLSLGRAEEDARVELFDVGGRRVRTLFAGSLAAGTHAFDWDGLNDDGAACGAGIYLARATAGEGTVMAKIVRMK